MGAAPLDIPAEFDLANYDYPFDPERVAAVPCERRDLSRLLVCGRGEERCEELRFDRLGEKLRAGDLLVLNRSQPDKVRLRLRRGSGARIEALLFRNSARAAAAGTRVECLLRGAGKLREAEALAGEGFGAMFHGPAREGCASLTLSVAPSGLDAFLQRHGEVPLPPYILKRRRETGTVYGEDEERYRTVYGDLGGGVAAPTAGFHFTAELLAALQRQGVGLAYVHLDVGSDTFLPIREADVRRHRVRAERFRVEAAAVEAVNRARARGGRIVAVGTTSVRALESAAAGGRLEAAAGETALTIVPGHPFRAVDGLLTNFHMPRSSLLVMVAAFAGRERLLRYYREAAARDFRMYSYGDAMLIL